MTKALCVLFDPFTGNFTIHCNASIFGDPLPLLSAIIDNIGSRMDWKWKTIRIALKTLMHAKVLQECLRHAAKILSQFMCRSGKLHII